MSDDLSKGDHVTWKSHGGTAEGVVEKKITSETEAQGGTARERIVDSLVRGARSLRRHAMFRRVVELDPEILVPYLVDRRGGVQNAILDHLVSSIKAGDSDGSLRAGEPVLLARSAILAVHGFVISAGTMIDHESPEVTEDALSKLRDRFGRRGDDAAPPSA